MTDRCAPPDGAEHQRWHWLSFSGELHVYEWRNSYWEGMNPLDRFPYNAARAGYRYFRPARPDDAEARERLEAENKRLREALAFYANAEIYKPHPHGPAFDRRDLSWTAKEALNAR